MILSSGDIWIHRNKKKFEVVKIEKKKNCMCLSSYFSVQKQHIIPTLQMNVLFADSTFSINLCLLVVM